MRPEQTIAYRVYYYGKDLLGVAKIDMPELKPLTETIGGSGVAGEYESPTLGMMGSMTAKLAWTSQTKNFYSLLNTLVPPMLECRASVQMVDEVTGLRKPVALKVTMFCQVKSSALGALETGKKHGSESEFEVNRLLVELDGETMLLLDKLNFMHSVQGVDVLLPVRRHLGLNY